MFLLQSDNKIRTIVLFCSLTGFSLSKSGKSRISRLQNLYANFVNLLLIIFAASSSAKILPWSSSTKTLANFVFSTRIPLLAISFALESVIIQANKKKLQNIVQEFEVLRTANFVHASIFIKHLKEANRRTFFYYFLAPLTISSGLFIAITTLSIYAVLGIYKDDMFESTLQETSGNGANEANAYLRILAVFILGNFKNVSQDALLLYLYCLMGQQISVLKNALTESHVEPFQLYKSGSKLKIWMNHQQTLAKLLTKINVAATPYIFVLAIYNASNMCIAAYILAKFTNSTTIMLVAAFYICSSAIKILMFCDVGQRLKNEGTETAEKILRMSMALELEPNIGIALHSAALDCQRSFVARCGPFFNLSIEFFSSVFGTVLTYFIVLMQLKD